MGGGSVFISILHSTDLRRVRILMTDWSIALCIVDVSMLVPASFTFKVYDAHTRRLFTAHSLYLKKLNQKEREKYAALWCRSPQNTTKRTTGMKMHRLHANAFERISRETENAPVIKTLKR